ncbi:hypothetical protein HOP50_12g65270 [Chloropicon primus]|nr:hypothetical protein HOP50_12g65270 [Chloropicon primus]
MCKVSTVFHMTVITFEAPELEDPDLSFQYKRVVSTDPGVKTFQTGEPIVTSGFDASAKLVNNGTAWDIQLSK